MNKLSLPEVNAADVVLKLDYVILTPSGFWRVCEYWPEMGEECRWFDGDMFYDAVTIFELPRMKPSEVNNV